uniref:O-antigen polymerase n=1 Tax=Clostridium sp. 12(A) TaxID=1163671 RepID=UPI000465B98C|nr:O-antigen polymerase [Clostridium sp. 12(A)]
MSANYIFLLFFTELFFLSISYTISNGNLMSPSFLSYAMFTLSTICVIYNIHYWEVEYSIKAWAVTTSGFLAMLLPEIFYTKKKHSYTNYIRQLNEKKIQNPIHIDSFINGFIILSSILIMMVYVYSVFTRGKILGATGLNVIGLNKYDSTSTGNILEKIFYRVLMILFYFYVYVVAKNIILCKVKVKSQIMNFIPIICYFIVTFFAGNRIGILKNLLAIYAAVLSMMYQSKNIKMKEFKKVIKYFVIFGIAMVALFYLSRVFTKVNTSTANRTFLEYITYYIGSPVYLFSKYIADPISVHAKNTLIGENTLTSLLQDLGYSPQYNNNFIYVGGNSNFAGNVFSWFEGPYHDYGFIGMLIFTIFIYCWFNHILYKGIIKKGKDISIILMMYFNYVFVMSFYYCQTMWAITITNAVYIFLIILMIRILPRLRCIRSKKFN